MLLAGDIGGTKTNLAIFLPEGDPEPQIQATFKSTDYPSLEAVVQQFLAEHDVSVTKAAFGVAGPVIRGESKVTNLPWAISETILQKTLGLDKVKLLNDLEATAYGIPHLSPSDLLVLNDRPPGIGHKAVIAPGTGLGEAILIHDRGHYHVIPSEGGHVDFAPRNPFEIELLRYLMGKFGHVSYERVCSGMGIPNIYAFLKESHFADESPRVAEALRHSVDPTPVIVNAALAGECELSTETLNAFISILGAEAGNLALKVMATGGVYIGGGIPPRILPKLKSERSRFIDAFTQKGRFAEVVSQIPVYVILNDKAALFGTACYGLGL